MNIKQVLIVRKDLNMRKGKMAAQCAHASLAVLLDEMNKGDEMIWKLCLFDRYLKEWLTGAFTKIVVYVNSEEELLSLREQAKENRIRNALITDNGTTEFGGVKTNTVLALGPHLAEDIDKISGHLPLL
jgi:PTH2 family peptidyl-tRNA hydrolase